MPADDTDDDTRRATWNETSGRWLDVVKPALIEHAKRVGQGEQGILIIKIDTDEMVRHLSGPSRVALEPTWFSVSDGTLVVASPNAPVAQGIEHPPPKRGAGSSNLPGRTTCQASWMAKYRRPLLHCSLTRLRTPTEHFRPTRRCRPRIRSRQRPSVRQRPRLTR